MKATEIHGQLARVKGYKPDSGWLSAEVLCSAKSRQHGVRMTVVGHTLCEPYPGMELFAQGKVTTHERFGEQFTADEITLTPPTDIELRARYLQHIVPSLTAREGWLAAQFAGDLATDLVPDIAEDKAELIRHTWAERALDPKEISFLRELGVPLTNAIAIVRYFGETGDKVSVAATENPYRIMDAQASFDLADSVALRMGWPLEAPERIVAGLNEGARRWTSEGHTVISRDDLRHVTAKLLTAMPQNVDPFVDEAVASHALIRREIDGRIRYQQPDYYAAEQFIAQDVKRLCVPRAVKNKPDATRIAEVCGFPPDPEQVDAIHQVFQHGLSIITGGPGCGKTTITRALVKTFPGQVWLVAPTGMAAKRLEAATSRPAATIHSFLQGQMDGDRWSFNYHRDHPLPIAGALLIIDEFSMVDEEVAAALFEAIPDDCTVVIAGDADQLPSVGPGAVLTDLIRANIPTTYLRHIHRQGVGSPIPHIARNVIEGTTPMIPEDGAARLIQVRNEKYAHEVFAVVRGMIQAGVTVDDVRVLSPMWRGPYGIDALNGGLQRLWNPQGLAQGGILGTRIEDADTGETFEEFLCPGDRAIMMKNDHQRKVFNGDIVRVIDCGMHKKTPWLDVLTDEGQEIRFEGARQVKQLRLAYATTVHRAQGSQFRHVVLALVDAHRRMLQRRVLYTAISRAQQTLTVVGHRHALELAVKDAGGVTSRETGLTELFADFKAAPLPLIEAC